MARGQLLAVGVVVAVLVALLARQTRAVDIGFGSCPEKAVVQNFDVDRYMGEWYEAERFWQIFELNGKCSKALYALNATTGQVSVRNSMVDTWSKQDKSIEGYAELVDPTASPLEAKLTVTFKVPVVGEQKAPYWVLDTDYTNYALVYSCSTPFNLFRTESAWILTRAAAVSDAVQQDIEKAISKANVNRRSFQKTAQDCENGVRQH